MACMDSDNCRTTSAADKWMSVTLGASALWMFTVPFLMKQHDAKGLPGPEFSKLLEAGPPGHDCFMGHTQTYGPDTVYRNPSTPSRFCVPHGSDEVIRRGASVGTRTNAASAAGNGWFAQIEHTLLQWKVKLVKQCADFARTRWQWMVDTTIQAVEDLSVMWQWIFSVVWHFAESARTHWRWGASLVGLVLLLYVLCQFWNRGYQKDSKVTDKESTTHQSTDKAEGQNQKEYVKKVLTKTFEDVTEIFAQAKQRIPLDEFAELCAQAKRPFSVDKVARVIAQTKQRLSRLSWKGTNASQDSKETHTETNPPLSMVDELNTPATQVVDSPDQPIKEPVVNTTAVTTFGYAAKPTTDNFVKSTPQAVPENTVKIVTGNVVNEPSGSQASNTELETVSEGRKTRDLGQETLHAEKEKHESTAITDGPIALETKRKKDV